MKRVYFVRHGQSEANAGMAGIGDSPLTKLGREQAAMIAARCTRLPIDIIVSSHLRRAHDTALAIKGAIQKEIIISNFFAERRPPVKCDNMTEEEWEPVRRVIDSNFYIPGYRYSDEENFDDLNVRAEKALDFLLSMKQSNILVATHGIFKRVLVGKAIFGADFTGAIFQHLLNGMRTQNTGLTIIDYDDVRWEVMTWNDHAHLG